MIIKFYSFLLCAVLISYNASAKSVGDSMGEFWNSLGGSSNVTKDSNYRGQSAGYVNFGSLYARSKVQRSQLAAIQLPSAKAGCGGIDVFAGGFSYIDSDQLVSLMKAIGSNASTFAFKIALATISPLTEGMIEELKKAAEAINSLNINSCEAGSALASTAFSYWDRTNKSACEMAGNSKGYFKDFTDARANCGNGGRRNETNNNASDTDQLMGGAGNINITWKAIKDSGLLGTANFDKEHAEYLMTLVGTVILKNPSSDNEGGEIEYIEGKISDKQVVAKFLDGGEFMIHECTDSEKCLDVTKDKKKYSISATEAFSGKVQQYLENIQDKVINDGALTTAELEFLNSTSIPIYKILNVHAAYYRGMPMFEASSYSELIAVELLYEYLTNLTKIVSDAVDRVGEEDIEKMTEFKGRIKAIRNNLYKEQQKINQRFQTTASLIERTEMIENVLADKVSSKVMSRYQWSRSIR